MRLLTNNPDKTASLEDYGVRVAERVPLTPHPNDHNLAYLRTKRDRMGHDLPDLAADRSRPRRTEPDHERRPEPPTSEPVDASDLRVAVVAASWHDRR